MLPCSRKPQQAAVHAQGVAARARGPWGRLCLSWTWGGYASSHERDNTNARSIRHASSRHWTLDTSRPSATLLHVKRLKTRSYASRLSPTLETRHPQTRANTARHPVHTQYCLPPASLRASCIMLIDVSYALAACVPRVQLVRQAGVRVLEATYQTRWRRVAKHSASPPRVIAGCVQQRWASDKGRAARERTSIFMPEALYAAAS